MTKFSNTINDHYSRNTGLSIPFLDWIIIGGFVLGIPLLISISVFLAGLLINSDFVFLLIILSIALILFLLVTFTFIRAYRNLHNYAMSVNYYHFFPSWRDIIIQLLRLFYLTLFTGVILGLSLQNIIVESFNYWFYFGIAVIISITYQVVLIFFAMNTKRNLLATAQEPVKFEIIDYIRHNHPNGHLIAEFRFADIKVQTLFLSAGVMSYGRKNICLISRYFNWKLSDEELIAVLSHEEGHIANQHILNSYFHEGIEVLLRSLRIFIIFITLIIISKGLSLFELLINDLQNLLVILGLFFLIFLSSTFFNLYRRYRVLLAEIRADFYGIDLVGSEILATTLRKLPSLIPSPLGYNQSSFLGFRVALLRNQTESD